jgi:hypothetical protein
MQYWFLFLFCDEIEVNKRRELKKLLQGIHFKRL